MIFELVFSCLLVLFFVAQYYLNRKQGVAEEKPKESIIAAAALGLLPVVMVVLVFTGTMDRLSYLPVVLRGFALVLMTVWFVRNFSQIKSLLQMQE